MKKKLALVLAGLLVVGSLTACGGGNNGGADASAKVKVGLGSCVSFSESYSIGEDHYGAPAEATNAQVDIHVAAVTLDAEGKIAACQIDAIQLKATVGADGTIATDEEGNLAIDTVFTSKYDLKEGYDMKKASPIAKEWYEQVDFYETWVIGKTVDQVEAGVGEDEYPSDTELLTGCTIKTGDITKAVVNACKTAVDTEATSADVLGLALIGEWNTGKYAAATAEADGTIQAYVNYACTTQDAEGKITSVVIDSIQVSPTWGVDGVLTTDVEQDARSKYTKKDDYGMQPASSLENGEWFEQIDFFKAAILGKTASEVAAIAVDEGGYPTDAELLTGCTMKVTAYKTVVEKSLAK